MAANVNSGSDATRAALIDQLRERLVSVEGLSVEMHQALKAGDASSIQLSTGRLETLALEFRVLHDEFNRLPERSETEPAAGELIRARDGLQVTALRIARSAAIGSGLLERLISMSRSLTATVNVAHGEPYLPSGQARDIEASGFQLKETV